MRRYIIINGEIRLAPQVYARLQEVAEDVEYTEILESKMNRKS